MCIGTAQSIQLISVSTCSLLNTGSVLQCICFFLFELNLFGSERFLTPEAFKLQAFLASVS